MAFDTAPSTASALSLRTRTVYTDGETHFAAYGFRRQDVITRVHGFVFSHSGRSVRIENLSATELDTFPQDKTTTQHLFLLQSDEYVSRVDVCVSPVFIQSVRLHTNKRVSNWFGTDWMTGNQETIMADPGYCINAFQTRYGNDSRYGASALACSQLRAVCMPLAVLADEYSIGARHITTSRTTIERSDGWQYGKSTPWDALSNVRQVFRSPVPVRAILITAENAVSNLEVLSDAEYARYQAPFDSNKTTSAWFGRDVPDNQAQWIDCKTRAAGSVICGFQLQMDSVDEISAVGVVYSVPVAPTSTTHAAAASATSSSTQPSKAA